MVVQMVASKAAHWVAAKAERLVERLAALRAVLMVVWRAGPSADN